MTGISLHRCRSNRRYAITAVLEWLLKLALAVAKASQAINALIRFSDKDQEFLLNVIQDYFDPMKIHQVFF